MNSALVLSGAEVLVVGDFKTTAGVTCTGTVRLNGDGTVDTTLGDSTLEIESVRQSQ